MVFYLVCLFLLFIYQIPPALLVIFFDFYFPFFFFSHEFPSSHPFRLCD